MTLLLSRKIGLSAGDTGLAVSVLGLLYGPASIVGGKLADSFGRKLIIIIFESIAVLAYGTCIFLEPSLIMVMLLAAAASALSACDSMPKVDELVKDRSVDYKHSDSLPPLEVPPDLTSTTIDDAMVVPDITPTPTATYSDYAGERAGGVASVPA